MPTYEALFLLTGSEELIKRLPEHTVATAGGVRLEGTDLTVQLEVSNERDATTTASVAAERFCDALSLRTGEHFEVQFRQLVERHRGRDRLASSVLPITWRVVSYEPEHLAGDIQGALDTSTLTDNVLGKASAYFRHALFLHQEAWRHVVPGSSHWALLAADALLHYYKAISVILGEAGTDHDYQSRYRQYGISRELWLETERVRALRKDADVAHYARDWEAIERARENIAFAKSTAGKVLEAYRRHQT